MKTQTSLKTILAVLMLAGLYACSASAPRPEPRQTANTKSGTIVAEHKQPTASKKIQIKANHPLQYTVKKGDTLWGIASLFLRDPWYWPAIWQHNPQIKNPHLIYPGDVLTLIYVNGKPQMLINGAANRGGATTPLPVRKLSPSIHVSSLETSIPSIPADAIQQFLIRPQVVTKQQLENAPYIIGSDENQLIIGTGDRVYIHGEIDKDHARFTIFHPGKALIDPQTKKVFGYEADYAGDVHITAYGDPATGEITSSKREILVGDRLLAEDKNKLNSFYFPKLPDIKIKGRIISLFGALSGVGQYQVVAINRGERDGLKVGNLLATFTKGNTVRDKFSHDKTIQLPSERSGLIMIFKVFDQVSYALVMESKRAIRVNDVVKTPKL